MGKRNVDPNWGATISGPPTLRVGEETVRGAWGLEFVDFFNQPY